MAAHPQPALAAHLLPVPRCPACTAPPCMQTRTCSASSTARSWHAASCTAPAVRALASQQQQQAGQPARGSRHASKLPAPCLEADCLPCPPAHPALPARLQRARTTRRACSPASSSSAARSSQARCVWQAALGWAGTALGWAALCCLGCPLSLGCPPGCPPGCPLLLRVLASLLVTSFSLACLPACPAHPACPTCPARPPARLPACRWRAW